MTSWQLTLVPDVQLQIFQAKTSADALDIIIDAQIFFDFDEPDSDKAMPSKALLSDFLVDSLDLWITDELLNEIYLLSDFLVDSLGRTTPKSVKNPKTGHRISLQ